MARKQNRFAESAASEVVVNGHVIKLAHSSDRAEVERTVAILDHKIAEDDWRPFASKEAAVQRWSELKGFRAAVLRAKGLI